MPYWDRRFLEISKDYPECTTDKYHIDILTAHFVMNPDRFDVVVASNLFGDILSDLGPACTGTIGIAPSANINPERKFPSLLNLFMDRLRYLWQEHCKSNWYDLEWCNDARSFG